MMPTRTNNYRTDWIPSLFNDLFNDWTPAVFNTGAARTAPAFNVVENEKNYQVEVAAPGMTKDDFNIQLTSDGDIVISMEKKTETKVGLGFAEALALLFITLKLCGVITWSWLWILSPLWISFAIVAVLAVIVLFLSR